MTCFSASFATVSLSFVPSMNTMFSFNNSFSL